MVQTSALVRASLFFTVVISTGRVERPAFLGEWRYRLILPTKTDKSWNLLDGQVVPVPIREDQQNDDRFVSLVRFLGAILIRCSDTVELCGGRNQFPCLLLLQAYAFRPNVNCFLGTELPVEVVKKRKMSS